MKKWTRYVHISRGAITLMVVTIIGGLAMIFVDSAQAENTIQVCTYGAMVIVVIRTQNRAESVIDAALRLAEELALARSDEGDNPDGSLATVVSLPTQRAEHPEHSEVP